MKTNLQSIIKIATSQFPVSSFIKNNEEFIKSQMKRAQAKGCDLIHFPEGSLSGYAGVDFQSFEDFDWEELKKSMQRIMDLARQLNIWVIVGSSHRLSGDHKPHNSLYIINDRGQMVDRYDKLFCAGNKEGTSGDLLHYTPGNHFTTFELNGVICGTLICHDYRYPELYRQLKKRNVLLVFHSYHAGNMNPERQKAMEAEVSAKYHSLNPGKTYPEITMPANMIANASNNYVWISCSNTSAKESCWGSFVVRPDGVITGKLEKNKEGLLITEINFNNSFYDSTSAWREQAINGVFHSGSKVDDIRSKERKKL